MANKKTKKAKTELIFDNKKREEFLTGFTKRKLQRKKKGAEQTARLLKAEQKRIKEETKDFKSKLKQSFKPLEELKEILGGEEEEYETEEAKVTINALKPEDMAQQKNFIGFRKVIESEDSEPEEEEKVNEIPGMELTSEKSKKTIKPQDDAIKKITSKIKTERDLKKIVSHSKLFKKQSG
ncbi:unnamed protein product [Diamesa serratosioi]